MIIWLDGTYGIGKSTVAEKIKQLLDDENIEILESDNIYMKMIQKNPLTALGTGTLPQNNIHFINLFKELIEEKSSKKNKIFIVDMSITQKECKVELFEYLKNKNIEILHIILTASKETLFTRIENSTNRDSISLLYMDENIKFLNDNFKTDIRVNTDNKTIDEIANEIILYIK